MSSEDGNPGFLKQQVALMSTPAGYLCVSSVLLADTHEMSIRVPLFARVTEKKTVETKGLINCRAEGNFIDKDFTKENEIPLFPLDKPVKAKNIDRTLNKKGMITHGTWLQVRLGNREEKIHFVVSGLGNDHIILGLPWLK